MLTSYRVIIVMISALLVSGFTLFHNPSLTELLDVNTRRIEWYGVFANQIFHPFQTYIAESLLLPFIAKLLGASVSRSSWLVLCAIVSFLVLPVLTAIALSKTKSAAKALLFLVVITPLLSLQDLPLGFPDPMTIMALGILAMQSRAVPLFLAAFFASISHFSLSMFSIVGLAVVIFCDKRDDLTNLEKKRRIYCLLSGAVVGKIFVGSWHLLLNYHAESRLQWAFNHGLQEFSNRYFDDPAAFWLTPGVSFLILYGIVLGVLALGKNLRLAFAGIVVLALSYVANYLALDGVRIFVTAASASLVYLSLRWVDCLDVLKPRAIKFFGGLEGVKSNVRYFHKLSIAALFSMIWLYTVSAGQRAGLGINFISSTYLDSQRIYWAYLCLALNFWMIAVFARRLNELVIRVAVTIYLGMILLIVIQWIRGAWWPDTVIVGWLKASLLALIGIVSYHVSGLVDFKRSIRLLVMAQRRHLVRKILGKFSV